jgi:hypothetical protein
MKSWNHFLVIEIIYLDLINFVICMNEKKRYANKLTSFPIAVFLRDLVHDFGLTF